MEAKPNNLSLKARITKAALKLVASAALVASAGSTPALTKSPGTPTSGVIQDQENTPEESRWTGHEWEVNQEIPVREWWDDMARRGYIIVDSVALQYAGREINDFVNGANLIPNPFEYWDTGRAFVGSCLSELISLEVSSQGHIIVSQDAYNQVPGAEKCDVYVNH